MGTLHRSLPPTLLAPRPVIPCNVPQQDHISKSKCRMFLIFITHHTNTKKTLNPRKKMSESKLRPSAWRSPQEEEQHRAAVQASKTSVARTSAQSNKTGDDALETSNIQVESENFEYLVDIGVNLADRRFSHDYSEVVQRSLEAKVSKLVITGTCLEKSRRAVQIAKILPGILYCTAGVHPHDAKTWKHDSETVLRNIIVQNSDVVRAVGECGLDFDRNRSTPEAQVIAFKAQLELACALKLPVFLHERSAFPEFLQILTEYRPRLFNAVVHCFTGTEEQLAAYLNLDVHIGITGWICDERRGLGLRDIVNKIPLDRLMIET